MRNMRLGGWTPTMIESVLDEPRANVLLLGQDGVDRTWDVCSGLLAGPAVAAFVGVTGAAATPERWPTSALERDGAGTLDVRLAYLGPETGADGPPDTVASRWPAVTASTAVSPGNLTALGATLSRWIADDSAPEGETVMCFDAVSTLLQHADTRTVFQFLHVLTDLVSTSGARGHYHLDPTVHEERAVSRIKLLFDVVVTVSPEGDVTVQSR